jgi:hypothetical protein
LRAQWFRRVARVARTRDRQSGTASSGLGTPLRQLGPETCAPGWGDVRIRTGTCASGRRTCLRGRETCLRGRETCPVRRGPCSLGRQMRQLGRGRGCLGCTTSQRVGGAYSPGPRMGSPGGGTWQPRRPLRRLSLPPWPLVGWTHPMGRERCRFGAVLGRTGTGPWQLGRVQEKAGGPLGTAGQCV